MIGLCELDELVNAAPIDNLLIVDCLNLSFRFKHRGMTDFAAEMLGTIQSLAKSYSAREVILTSDWRHSAYRRNLSEVYKTSNKEKYENQTEEEKTYMKQFFEGYEKALELAKTQYPLLRFKFVEADDLAAYVVKEVSHLFTHTWLISSDADWDLLLSPKVSRFSFVTRKEYTVDNFYEHHECETPEDYISIKVLMGDSGDTVAGVPSVGIKRAYNLVREFGSAMDVYDSMPLQGKQVFVRNINNSEDLILLNYELMDLLAFCEVAIAFPDSKNLEEIKEFCNGYT